MLLRMAFSVILCSASGIESGSGGGSPSTIAASTSSGVPPPHGLGHGERSAREALPQRLTLDVLAGDEVHALVDADVEDRDDVGVVEHRRALRLALEALQLPRLGVAQAKELERDFAVHDGVLG